MTLLFDFYGALLTEKQQKCLAMHFSDDLSLSEMAAQLNISRQAAYDIIHRSEQQLEEYEDKLRLVERHRDSQDKLKGILDDLSALSAARALEGDALMQQITDGIKKLLDKSGEA